MEPTMENDPGAEAAGLLRKQIASTRTFLYIVAAITLISAIILTPFLHSAAGFVNLGVTAGVSAIYLFLAIWARKKPYSAVCYGLLLLALVVVGDIFLNPFGPFNRWQSKVLTLLFLFFAMGDSRDAQRKMSGGSDTERKMSGGSRDAERKI